LALANSDGPGAETITFDASLSGQTLTLTQGELDITTDGITIEGDIDGNGTPDITISGNHASRVFSIDASGTISAALDGLVIKDGSASSGGGIFVGQNDALTLSNATVSGNSATFVVGSGGGIYGDIHAAIFVQRDHADQFDRVRQQRQRQRRRDLLRRFLDDYADQFDRDRQ